MGLIFIVARVEGKAPRNEPSDVNDPSYMLGPVIIPRLEHYFTTTLRLLWCDARFLVFRYLENALYRAMWLRHLDGRVKGMDLPCQKFFIQSSANMGSWLGWIQVLGISNKPQSSADIAGEATRVWHLWGIEERAGHMRLTCKMF